VSEYRSNINCADCWFTRYYNSDFEFSEWRQIEESPGGDKRLERKSRDDSSTQEILKGARSQRTTNSVYPVVQSDFWRRPLISYARP